MEVDAQSSYQFMVNLDYTGNIDGNVRAWASFYGGGRMLGIVSGSQTVSTKPFNDYITVDISDKYWWEQVEHMLIQVSMSEYVNDVADASITLIDGYIGDYENFTQLTREFTTVDTGKYYDATGTLIDDTNASYTSKIEVNIPSDYTYSFGYHVDNAGYVLHPKLYVSFFDESNVHLGREEIALTSTITTLSTLYLSSETWKDNIHSIALSIKGGTNYWFFEDDYLAVRFAYPDNYLVDYDSNGGTSVESELTTPDALLTEPTEPTREGYTFDGWYEDDGSFTEEWIFASDEVMDDMTLYANWTTNTYTIYFDSNEGTEVDPITQSYQSLVTGPADPTRSGYTFLGWYETEHTYTDEFIFPELMPLGDIMLHALWQPPIYHTISFDTNGGSTQDDYIYVDDATTIAQPDDPTRVGHSFLGWYEDDGTFLDAWDFEVDTVSGDLTLYANWLQHDYTITFDSNEGSAVTPITDANYGDTIAEPSPDPTRTDYFFEGWYEDDETFLDAWDFEVDTVSGDLTLYANWKYAIYTVTFETNGGAPLSPIENVDHGDTITEPAITGMAGYTFDGWYVDDEIFLIPWDFDTDVVTDDMTLYAKWSTNVYDVFFESNGGTMVASQEIEYGNLIEEPEDPERPGAMFQGWFLDDDTFNIEWDFDTDTVTTETTLYAKWQLNTYVVYFYIAEGMMESEYVVVGDLIDYPDMPTLTGYGFIGWYKDATYEEVWNFNTDEMPPHDLTLYAKWHPNISSTIDTWLDSFGADNAVVKTFTSILLIALIVIVLAIMRADKVIILFITTMLLLLAVIFNFIPAWLILGLTIILFLLGLLIFKGGGVIIDD